MISGLHREVLRVINQYEGLVTLSEVNALQDAQSLVMQGGETTPAFVASDSPIWCNGLSFYRPSIAAEILIEEYEEIEGLFDEDYKFDIFGILVLHNSRNKEFFQTISPENVLDRVNEFSKNLTIGILEVRQLFADALAGFPNITNLDEQRQLKESGREVNPEVDHLLTTSQLMKHYGGNLDYWFYDVSVAQVIWLTQASYKCLEDGDTPNPDSPLSKAQRNFIAIRKKVILRCREMKK
jgi:hypothetical protein